MYSLNSAVNDGKGEEETVQGVRLDTLFTLYDIDHVDFLKVDIEGAETEVFGGSGFDRVKDKIDVIMGEFHTGSGVNPNQFGNYFRDRGFEFTWLNATEASVFVAERLK